MSECTARLSKDAGSELSRRRCWIPLRPINASMCISAPPPPPPHTHTHTNSVPLRKLLPDMSLRSTRYCQPRVCVRRECVVARICCSSCWPNRRRMVTATVSDRMYGWGDAFSRSRLIFTARREGRGRSIAAAGCVASFQSLGKPPVAGQASSCRVSTSQ